MKPYSLLPVSYYVPKPKAMDMDDQTSKIATTSYQKLSTDFCWPSFFPFFLFLWAKWTLLSQVILIFYYEVRTHQVAGVSAYPTQVGYRYALDISTTRV